MTCRLPSMPCPRAASAPMPIPPPVSASGNQEGNRRSVSTYDHGALADAVQAGDCGAFSTQSGNRLSAQRDRQATSADRCGSIGCLQDELQLFRGHAPLLAACAEMPVLPGGRLTRTWVHWIISLSPKPYRARGFMPHPISFGIAAKLIVRGILRGMLCGIDRGN